MTTYTPEQVEAMADAIDGDGEVIVSLRAIQAMLTAYAATIRQQAARVDEGMMAALREIAALRWQSAATNGCAHDAVSIATAALAAIAQNTQGDGVLTDERIEEIVRRNGGKWDGDRWIIEDADLHPIARTLHAERARVPDDGRYYLQDTRSYVGNCPLWWGKNGNGYVTRLDEAHRYTHAEAMKRHRARHTDVPWLCDEIDALRRPTVDVQHMRPVNQQITMLAAAPSAPEGDGGEG